MSEDRTLSGTWSGFYPGDWVRPRQNSGTWMPLVDVVDIFPGNRCVSRQGKYELYDAPIGVHLEIEESTKAPMTFDGEVEWESGGVTAGDIWYEDGKLHMFYWVLGLGSCYAVSEDGYQWTRAELGEVEYNGSRKNNIRGEAPEGNIFEDPSAPPEERFKAMSAGSGWYDPDTWEKLASEEANRRWDAMHYGGHDYDGPRVVLRGWLEGWTSPDRFRGWKKIKEPLAEYSVNGGIVAGYDEATESYYAYLQPQGFAPDEPLSIGAGSQESEIVRRANGIARTRDFRHWPAPKLTMYPDAQDGLDISFYAHNYFPYPGRTDLHGMLTPIFHHATGQMDVQIAFSRDGLVWYRPERRPIVTLGPPGSGEEGMIGTGTLHELPDGNWAAAYWGDSRLHNVKDEYTADLFPLQQPRKMGWALWQPHRLCGYATQGEGAFTIPTIERKNHELRLNYRCEPGGWVSVELLPFIPSMFHGDIDPIPDFTFETCDRLTGDALDAPVSWNGNSDLSKSGEMLAIRVKMFQAKVFAYRI